MSGLFSKNSFCSFLKTILSCFREHNFILELKYEKQFPDLILNERTMNSYCSEHYNESIMHLCIMQKFLNCSLYFYLLLTTSLYSLKKKSLFLEQILIKNFSIRSLSLVFYRLENSFLTQTENYFLKNRKTVFMNSPNRSFVIVMRWVWSSHLLSI